MFLDKTTSINGIYVVAFVNQKNATDLSRVNVRREAAATFTFDRFIYFRGKLRGYLVCQPDKTINSVRPIVENRLR